MRKAGAAAVHVQDNWMTVAQAMEWSGGGRRGRRGGMDASAVNEFPLPLDVANDYVNKLTDFKQSGNTITARLSEEEVTRVLQEKKGSIEQ